MNKAKKSFEDNKDEILKNLPEEFHADFHKEVEAISDATPEKLMGDASVEAIKAELIANPAVDENAAANELKDIKPSDPLPGDE